MGSILALLILAQSGAPSWPDPFGMGGLLVGLVASGIMVADRYKQKKRNGNGHDHNEAMLAELRTINVTLNRHTELLIEIRAEGRNRE